MNVSTFAKILIAVFLGAFLWLVITNIQAPRQQQAEEEPRERLRDELIGIAEDVEINIGDVAIQAKVQETYRNGEIHYQDFQMVQEREDRTLTASGRTAQTSGQGTEIEFFIMNGDVVVDTSDGLHLETESLNYESSGDRIFTQRPSEFSLNEMAGRCGEFAFMLETNRLDMRGSVEAVYSMEPDDEGAKPRRIFIRGQRVIYDQSLNLLILEENARISEAGSYISGNRVEADLTEDNNQFRRITVITAETKSLPDFGGKPDQEAVEEQEEDEAEREQTEPEPGAKKANLSHHTSGIKEIRANTLLLDFTTGDDNLLKTVNAIGAASMEITPVREHRRAEGAELKRITGDQITGQIDTGLGGLKSLNVVSEEGLSTLEQRPLIRSRKKQQKARANQPRITKAKSINMTLDSETSEVSGMVMQQEFSMEQGDLEVSADTCNYQAVSETMVLSGRPVVKDSVKRVSGNSMTLSLAIDDLAANGKVSSQFFKVEEKKNSEARGVFSIGKEGGETLVKADSLRLDYSNNILRYRNGVTINQGNTTIASHKLDIYQVEEKLIAIGAVTANLTYENIESTRQQNGETEDGGQEQEEKSGVFLTGEYLEINKSERFIRVRNNAKAIQKGMTFSAQEINYELDEEDRILRFAARRAVIIELGGPVIRGDVATFDPENELLVVEGRVVQFKDPGGLSGSNYRKIEYDMKTQAIRFFGQGDTPINTRVLEKAGTGQ